MLNHFQNIHLKQKVALPTIFNKRWKMKAKHKPNENDNNANTELELKLPTQSFKKIYS